MAEQQPKKRKGLAETAASPPPRPSLDAFLDYFFAEAGGPAAFAKKMYGEFLAAEAGSQLRARVVETILRSLKSSDAHGKPLDDLGVLTDADLIREMERREKELMAHLGVPDAAADRPTGPGLAPAAIPPGPGHPARPRGPDAADAAPAPARGP